MKLATIFVSLALAVSQLVNAASLSVAGTWKFAEQLANGKTGTTTIVMKQSGAEISGTYDGPLGHYPVEGSLDNDRITLKFQYVTQGITVRMTYEGTITGSAEMEGTMKIAGGDKISAGKWTGKKS